jgi:hypothetical protein
MCFSASTRQSPYIEEDCGSVRGYLYCLLVPADHLRAIGTEGSLFFISATALIKRRFTIAPVPQTADACPRAYSRRLLP